MFRPCQTDYWTSLQNWSIIALIDRIVCDDPVIDPDKPLSTETVLGKEIYSWLLYELDPTCERALIILHTFRKDLAVFARKFDEAEKADTSNREMLKRPLLGLFIADHTYAGLIGSPDCMTPATQLVLQAHLLDIRTGRFVNRPTGRKSTTTLDFSATLLPELDKLDKQRASRLRQKVNDL